jgi:hypothetical protein
MKHLIYEITDDSGLLALIDPVVYRYFVDSDWTLDQLVQHFKSSINDGHLALWGTGREETWRVDIGFERSTESGFREFNTLLRASSDHLLLTNYEALTMAAQFEDVKLPEPHQRDLLIPVLSGLYLCHVVQRFDPESFNPTLRDEQADFLVEFSQIKDADSVNVEIASGIPWSDF